jgi:hypothetical protein
MSTVARLQLDCCRLLSKRGGRGDNLPALVEHISFRDVSSSLDFVIHCISRRKHLGHPFVRVELQRSANLVGSVLPAGREPTLCLADRTAQVQHNGWLSEARFKLGSLSPCAREPVENKATRAASRGEHGPFDEIHDPHQRQHLVVRKHSLNVVCASAAVRAVVSTNPPYFGAR